MPRRTSTTVADKMLPNTKHGHLTGLRRHIAQAVEQRSVQNIIVVLIIINAITLGLETVPSFGPFWMEVFHLIDVTVLTIFIIEIGAKLYAYRRDFFRDGWNIFDVVVVLTAMAPHHPEFAALRAFRIIRLLRILSMMPQQRMVINSLMRSLPAVGGMIFPLLIVFYVFAVISTKLFGPVAPELFGTLGASMFTLFQLMTLEGWAEEVARPVMEVYPWSWAFFIPYILTTTFVFLNMMSAIINNVMHTERDKHKADNTSRQLANDGDPLHVELQAIRAELRRIQGKLKKMESAD